VKVLVGIAWLWAFLTLGSAVAGTLGLPLPGSVVGMVLLWGALEAKIVRLEWLDRGATTLLGVLGLLFVPAGVGFVQFLGAGSAWVAAVAVVAVGALVTLTVTGHVVQHGLRRG
jgi:holin-like protein